jgi:hypothetical protein
MAVSRFNATSAACEKRQSMTGERALRQIGAFERFLGLRNRVLQHIDFLRSGHAKSLRENEKGTPVTPNFCAWSISA